MNELNGIVEKLRKNREQYKANVSAVRAAWEYSDAKKAEELRATYDEAAQTHKRLEGEYRQTLSSLLTERQQKVFAAPQVYGADKAMSLFLYRDALRHAAQVTEPKDLQDVLESAYQTGDHAQARAVLYRGYSRGNSAIVQDYFSKYPAELPAWDSFMDVAEQHNKLERLGITFATGIPEPERPQEATYANQQAIPSYPPN